MSNEANPRKVRPVARPLSPHLMHYSFQSNMALSILHRMSGVGLAVGLCVLVAWLFSIGQGAESYAQMRAVLETWPGVAVSVGLGLALCYHAATGLRHLLWDTGRGLELDGLLRSNAVVFGLAVLFAVALFFA